jgi:hypothetical protein
MSIAAAHVTFVQSPAALITRLAAFIPFSFSPAGGRLSSAASERRLFAFDVAITQRESSRLQVRRDICHIGLTFEGEAK